MIKYQSPAAIECSQAKCKFRKLQPQRPIIHPRLKMLYKFKFTKNGEVYIAQELNPKIPIIDKTSMLNTGDGIRGNIISISTTSPFRKPIVKAGSATHQAQFLLHKAFTYAKLEKSYSTIP